jgi:hypothetical protein
MSEVTRILQTLADGDAQAGSRLLPLVYDELRRLASRQLAREAPGQTLQPTALVHEAYLRLVGAGDEPHWHGRTASDDETARVWDADTGKEQLTLTGHAGAVTGAAFSPDGTHVATVSAEGTGRIWLLNLLPVAEARKPRELTAADRRDFEIVEEQ